MSEHTIYFTFGVQYARLPDILARQRFGKEINQYAPWMDGNGYLAVTVKAPDEYDFTTALVDNTARGLVHQLTGGKWAFSYYEPPEARHAPDGEIARLTLEIKR